MVYMRKLESTVGLIGMLALLYVSTSRAEDEYYTWIDEDGVVNYSEHNPQGFDARFITRSQRFGYQSDEPVEQEIPEQTEAQRTAAPAAEEERDIDAEIAIQKARIDQEIAAAKKSNCNIRKLNLAQLENYNRIKVQDEDGQIRVLSEEEKQSRVDRAKTTISENCS